MEKAQAMDLRQLEYFTAIIREGSLTAAAKACQVAQPSLSQQLKALEDELGEPLVHRRPRGVEPTSAGLVLLEHAGRLLDEARKLRERFEKRRETQEGKLAFGIIPTIAPYLLPKLLKPFREVYPKIDLQIQEARTSELIQQIVDGTIEFAVLSDVAPQVLKKWSLHAKELFREPLLLALPANHPLSRVKSAPRPDQLAAEELIHLKDGHCLTDRTLKVCRLKRLDARLECDQLGTALAMVASGMGFAVVPEFAARTRNDPSLVFRRFANPDPERTISLLKRRAQPLSKGGRELANLLQGIQTELR
ncbi:MAG: LysR family transcriptional regulator [Akkermansiaceae bacterium]|nr:LysR family transcriptional regulator [Akkermansiaceae bacterium]